MLSAPAIASDAVVVRTVAGVLLGLSREDGKILWREEQQIPRLTLRGAAAPVVAGNAAICGFDNGRVIAAETRNGEVLWEQLVSAPSGRTELERMVDIDAAVKVSGVDVFVAGFQGRVAMLALDQFVLWTNTEKGYKSAKDYVDAAKAAGPNKFKMGGTGSKQEDQIITVALEKATGTKFTYVPFAGGGAVAVQLVGNHVDSTVNNPIEAVAQWRAGKLTAQCVFDTQRMPYKEKITPTLSWNDVPTCREVGVNTDYVMLRGIFMPPGVTQAQVDFYIDLFKKVRETPEWKKFMADGAFNQTFMTGKEFTNWLEKADAQHAQLMKEAGFIAK